MSTPFQNRLVGTVIVAAAAIIFLPDLLDGKKQTYQAKFQPIPQPPMVENTTTPKEFPEQKLNLIEDKTVKEDVAIDDPMPEVKSQPVETQAQKSDGLQVNVMKPSTSITEPDVQSGNKEIQADKPITVAKANFGDAWVIQLGSFSKQKNVDDLVGKLKKAGYVVFTKPVKTKNRTLTKVFVGPEINKSTLEKQLPELVKVANVTGKIAKYSPTNN